MTEALRDAFSAALVTVFRSFARRSFAWRRRRRPLENCELPVGLTLQRRRVEPEQLPRPPDSLLTLLRRCAEPVLPNHRAHEPRRLGRKGIRFKERHNIRTTREQPLLCAHDDWIGAPIAQRSKPQIPVESRLIRRVDARRLVRILGLISKLVGCPILPIHRTL